jgi:NitT/TauT family transport system substrate-binding protein
MTFLDVTRPVFAALFRSRTHFRALAALATGAAALVLSGNAFAQAAKPMTKIRFEEAVHSIFYLPHYAAMSKGFFRDAGLDVSMKASQGIDKGMAALLSNSADIALIGPETAVYVQNSESPAKTKIFAGLTATDGFLMMSRKKLAKFDWTMLKGKEVMGFRVGSSPHLFLLEAIKKNKMDPDKDVKLLNNIAPPARAGAWIAGQGEFGIFLEPEAGSLEREGKAFAVASLGQEVGNIDYTVYIATDAYIKKNPEVIQAWTDAITRAQKYIQTAPTSELVKIAAEQFPGLDVSIIGVAIERYKTYSIWKKSPLVEPRAIERLQDLLVGGNLLDKGKRVKYEDVVTTDFANKAIARVK